MGSLTFYYRVSADSLVMKAISQIVAERAALQMAYEAFKEKHGAASILVRGSDYRFVGAKFSGVVPAKGWRYSTKVELHVPNKSSKEGKALQAEIDAFPKTVDGLGFSARLQEATGLEETFTVFEDSKIRWSGYGVFGEKVVLTTPRAVTIDGLTEITASEFQAILTEHTQKVQEPVAA